MIWERHHVVVAGVVGVLVLGGVVVAVRAGGPPAGCPREGKDHSASVAAVLLLGGRTYIDTGAMVGVPTDRVVGTIRCRITTRTPTSYQPRDGDSTVLGPGTRVYALVDVDPAVAVTAVVRDRPSRFDALPAPVR